MEKAEHLKRLREREAWKKKNISGVAPNHERCVFTKGAITRNLYI